MSVLWAGNMRGPRLQTLVSVLLLLLLVSGLRHTVLCEDEEPEQGEEDTPNTEESRDEGAAEEAPTNPTGSDLDTSSTPTATKVTDTENGEGHGFEENRKRSRSGSAAEPPENPTGETLSTEVTPVEEGLDLIIIIIPVALVIFIIALIVCGICIHRRMNSKTRQSQVSKEDPYLDDSNTDKVPMPMFEEDVPSVLELEMEELDDWIKKDGGSQLA